MATVSHYAMQPYSAFYGDGSTTQVNSSQYYVASNQQVSPMYDKTKKTWSQRLKITKTEKATSPLSELPDYSQSALSRSMKYAEPWLYGTVRGIPARPVHGQSIFSPIPAEVAVVVCSCPEYLSGTKRDVKKASVCKKCKGSRLPLAPIGGTVRIRPTSAPIVHAPRASVGTVRIPSSSVKSRPTILDPKNDPYDLMRRSRLLSPEPKPLPMDKTLKMRAKSASPTRGRSRNRPQRPEDLPLSNNASTLSGGIANIRPRGTVRMKQERWLESMENDPGGRKSILLCEVNPYDLISSKGQTINEFAPEQEEMFLPSYLKSESATKRTLSSNGSNIKAIGGQRISLGENMSPKNTDPLIRFDRNPSAETTLIPRKKETSTQQELKRYETSLTSNSCKQSVSVAEQLLLHPLRPPRKKQETCSADEDSPETTERDTSSTPNEQTTTSTMIHVTSPPSSPTQTSSPAPATNPAKRQGIKSILKRPSPVSISSADIDAKFNESYHPGKTSPSTANIGKSIVETKRLTFATETSGGSGVGSSPSSLSMEERRSVNGSQFYCPLPQTRKKVQFMVENRVIHHETYDDGADQMIVGSTVVVDGNQEETVTFPTWRDQKISTNASNGERISADTNNSYGMEKHQLRPNILETSREANKFSRESCTNDLMMNSPMRTMANTATLNSTKNGVIVINPSEKRSSHYQEQKMDQYKGQIILDDSIVRKGDLQCSNKAESDSNTAIVVPTTTPTTLQAPRRCISLRRTNSARSNNTTTVLLNFNDTMALRIKNPRTDSRDIFASNGRETSMSAVSCTLPPPSTPRKFSLPPSSSIPRPSGNPPDPPLSPLRIHQQDTIVSSSSSSGSLVSSLMAQVDDESQPTGAVTMSPSESSEKSKESCSSFAARGNKSTSTADRNPSQNELHRHKDNDYDGSQLKESTYCVGIAESFAEKQPARPPRQVNKKISWLHETANNDVTVKSDHQDNPLNDNGGSNIISNGIAGGANRESTTSINGTRNAHSHECDEKNSFVQRSAVSPAETLQKPVYHGKMSEHERILLARNEILNGSRLFGNVIDKGGVQKTVVRVAPFQRDGLEVHRLKIRHEDDDMNNAKLVSPQKTSILINGDNCYSTVNVCSDTPLYQSSVVVNNGVSTISTDSLKMSSNTVTISVSNPSTPDDEIISQNNKINSLLSFCNGNNNSTSVGSPLTPSSSSSFTGSDGDSSSYSGSLKRGSTLITLDFDATNQSVDSRESDKDALAHERELVKILRNPVEAVKRNLVPHVCGKSDNVPSNNSFSKVDPSVSSKQQNSFINKLLEDPTLNQLAEGLESEVVVKLIENSLKRLKDSRQSLDTSGTKDSSDMDRLIDLALSKVKEERAKLETSLKSDAFSESTHDNHENGSISSGNSYGSANYDVFDFDNNESDCYQSCSSEMTTEEDAQSTRSKFYQMLVDATLSEIEITTSNDDDHHYESIRMNCDPIYEEISDVPPPLPLSPPPLCDTDSEKKTTKSMFEGASKYDILSYLVDAKERGLVREEPYEYNFSNTSEIIVEEDLDTLADLNKKKIHDISSRVSHLSVTSDSSEDISLTSSISEKLTQRRPTSEIERNDSGVGSETSKSSRSKYQNPPSSTLATKNSPIHLCEDCDGPVETQITDSGVMYAPLVCRKCSKKRAERKEIIIEIVETEEKYGRDLQIILEEFCKPMLVAGLLTQEQLSAIFLNTEELIENNQALAEKMRDALDIALDQGDDDLLTVNVGKLFLESTPMLHAFESYCVRQAGASLLLANLEKDKELLRIFLRVSQMENAVLRRMNLNSFLMVPVQRVTKYPLLLARLYKVTPHHLVSRPLLKQAQEKIELHLNHMNQEAKDVPTKLWRRISSSSPNRRLSCEIDMINIKLRKMSIDVLEWNHDEVRFALEGKLLYTQPTDSNWKKARTIKLTHINALLVTNGKPSVNYKPEKAIADQLSFPKHTGIREASLLMVKEKGGRYTLIREPLYLDRCIVCTEADWDDYFEVHEISTKETFIFKAEDGARTKQWYTQLQYHSQNMGAWRKRRNALANIMINGMLSRT